MCTIYWWHTYVLIYLVIGVLKILYINFFFKGTLAVSAIYLELSAVGVNSGYILTCSSFLNLKVVKKF